VTTSSVPKKNPSAVRRPRRSSAAHRSDVLAAARRLFAERGFHATTTRDLAEASDINDALLYRYFPGKEAILAALVDEAITGFTAAPPIPPLADLSLAELLEVIGAAFVTTATTQLDLLTILISEHQILADDHRFVEFIHQAATNLGILLEQIAEPGARVSGYLTARAYMGSLVAFVILQNVLGLSAIEPIDPADYIRNLARVTAQGLGAPPT
jgi:AcrR family transcriptional regulator